MSKYNWKEPDSNPDNMIYRRAFLMPKAGAIFIHESHAPEGAPISVVDFSDGQKRGLLLGADKKPFFMTLLTTINEETIGSLRFREVQNDDEFITRPYMYIPICLPGCPYVYRLTILGMAVHEFNQLAIEFDQKVIKPYLKVNPEACAELFGFALKFQLSRKVLSKNKKTFILAPEFEFDAYENLILTSEEIAQNENLFLTQALPFLQKQEEQRLKERNHYFGKASGSTEVAEVAA